MRAFWIGAVALTVAGCVAETGDAPDDYALYCATCHGADARGNGPLSEEMGLNAPDLTQIAARNGGTFPYTRVMSVIDGYTRADQRGSDMPPFGALLEGETVMLEYENGVMTPTPAPLVALAKYLEAIQG